MKDILQGMDDWQKEIETLDVFASDHGLVVILGDGLFDPGQSELRRELVEDLDILTEFLHRHHDAMMIIEGHTDTAGKEYSNLYLSQRRANSVKNYLTAQGIAPARLAASGNGNDTPHHNLIEVIIEHHTARSWI